MLKETNQAVQRDGKGSRFSVLQQTDSEVAAPQAKIRPKAVLEAKGAKKLAQKDVLRDVSNVTPSGQPLQKGDGSRQVPIKEADLMGLEEGLFPVKVVYQNPTFQSHVHTPKPVKAKAKAALRSTGSKAKGPAQGMEMLGNKKRSFKKTTSIPGLNSASSDQVAISGNVADDTRKPPDRS
ncbi:hypothetical protein LINPERHAP2_LOCUS4337 [Linum perenne]